MKASSPQIKAWLLRPYSWSQHSSFDYNPEEWFKRYILGEEMAETPQLKFGKLFAEAVEWGKPMAPLTVYRLTEHYVEAPLSDFKVNGYLDSYDRLKHDRPHLAEYKTGAKAWTQKRVNEHGQLTYYAMLLWLRDKIKPEDIDMILQWVPTSLQKDYSYGIALDAEGKAHVHTFETSRTMADVLKLVGQIEDRRRKMYEYARSRK